MSKLNSLLPFADWLKGLKERPRPLSVDSPFSGRLFSLFCSDKQALSFKNSKDQPFPSAALGFLESHHGDADYVPGMGNTREGARGFPGGGSSALGINPNSFRGPEGL